ncbi:hypothetical protein MMMDOFMJ_1669 [Methylobacterium gnaphalii]|nr:hypothetical protein MMMDOFMJ_1669 [Methylobacterium gnaphalii]
MTSFVTREQYARICASGDRIMHGLGRRARLRAFVSRGAGLPFIWGERDCCLWVCEWIAAERGVDPAASLRGTYDTMLSCNRILAREGGLPALASRLAVAAGLTETATPRAGDVGVIETPIGPFLMVCLGDTWATKAKDGMAFAPTVPVKAWTV